VFFSDLSPSPGQIHKAHSVTLSKGFGTWDGLPIIAIGPLGGKIVGYSKGKPIYAGSKQAAKLAQQQSQAAAHKGDDEASGSTLGGVIDAWLELLGFKSKAQSGSMIAYSAEDAAELKEYFGVSGKPMSGGAAVAFEASVFQPFAGKPLTPKLGQEVSTHAALASGTFGEDAPWTKEELAKLSIKGGPLGSHGHTYIVTDGKGAEVGIWKTKDATIYRAEEACARIGQLVFPKPALIAKAEVVTLGGAQGVLLSHIKGTELGAESSHKISDAKLQKHGVRLIQHQVLDWLLSNHDAHGGNFLVTPDGDVAAIDKGQAWRFVGNDKLTGDLSYNPNNKSYGLAAQQVWTRWKEGSIKLDEKEVIAAVEEVLGGIATLSKEQYEQIIAPYLALKPASVKPALARFESMHGDWESFLSKQFGHKVKLTPSVKGAEAAPALTIVADVPAPPAPAPKAPKPKPKAPAVDAPVSEPKTMVEKLIEEIDAPPAQPKLVIQLPGWPKKKGNVTVHHPGNPAPATWPAKYPGPGYKATVVFKGKPYGFDFGISHGKPFVSVTDPSGKVVKEGASIQEAADIPSLIAKGLPLNLSSTQKKNMGYSAMKLFQIAAFADDFANVSMLNASPASESVAELEATQVVTPEKKTLNHHEIITASLGGAFSGAVSDMALLPVDVQDYVSNALASYKYDGPWGAPSLGTVFVEKMVGDVSAGGGGYLGITAMGVSFGGGGPVYQTWNLFPDGTLIGTGAAYPDSLTLSGIKAAFPAQEVAIPGTEVPAAPVKGALTPSDNFATMPKGTVVEGPSGKMYEALGNGAWKTGTSTLSSTEMKGVAVGGLTLVEASDYDYVLPPTPGTVVAATLPVIEAAKLGAVLAGSAGTYEKVEDGEWKEVNLNVYFSPMEMADGALHKVIAWPLVGSPLPEATQSNIDALMQAPIGSKAKHPKGQTYTKVSPPDNAWGSFSGVWVDSTGQEHNSGDLDPSVEIVEELPPPAQNATPVSTMVQPKVVTDLESVPAAVKGWVSKVWDAQVAFGATSKPGGHTAAQKSPLWDAWVPPPGKVLEGEVDGKKFFMTQVLSGYLNDGSAAACVRFEIIDEHGNTQSGVPNPNAEKALGWPMAWAIGDLAFNDEDQLPPFIAKAKAAFNLENAAFPANSTALDDTAPSADSVITTPPEDIPASELPKKVTKKISLADAITLPSTKTKYGFPSGFYSSPANTGKFGANTSYINVKASNNTVDWPKKLQMFLDDHGVLASHIVAGPSTSQFGGAYVVIKDEALDAETPIEVTVAEATQTTPDPVPAPWPVKGEAFDVQAMHNAPGGTYLTKLGEDGVPTHKWIKGGTGFYTVDIESGKLGTTILAGEMADIFAQGGVSVTTAEGETVYTPDKANHELAVLIEASSGKKAQDLTASALAALPVGTVLLDGEEDNPSVANAVKLASDSWFVTFVGGNTGYWSNEQAQGSWIVQATPDSTPLTTSEHFDALPVGSIVSQAQSGGPVTYKKDVNGKWKLAHLVPGGTFTGAVMANDVSNGAYTLLTLGAAATPTPPATPTAPPPVTATPALPKKINKSATKKSIKALLVSLPVGVKLTLPNGSVLEKNEELWWTLDGKGPWGTFTASTYIHKQGAAITPPGMAAAPPLPAKPKPPPKPEDPAIAAAKAEKLAEQLAKFAKAKEYAVWAKANPQPWDAVTLQALSAFQNSGKPPPKLYAHTHTSGASVSLLLGSPDFDALKQSVDNWEGFPPYEEVDSPLGKLVKVDPQAFADVFPNVGVVVGPDGATHPKGTTFSEKQVSTGTVGAAVKKEPGHHKTVSDTTSPADTAAVKWKYDAYGTVEEKEAAKGQALASLAKHGLTPTETIVGSANIITKVPLAALAKDTGTTTEVVATPPPQLPAFVAATPPFSVGAQQQGAIALNNEADIDVFDVIKPGLLGHSVRTGGAGLWANSQVRMRKVIESGKEYVEVVGDLVPLMGVAKPQGTSHVTLKIPKAKYSANTGKHTASAFSLIDTQANGTTLASGTTIGVFHSSDGDFVMEGTCVIRVPAENISNLRAEMTAALKAVGVSDALASSTHEANAERVFIKSQIVRRCLGSKGWGQNGKVKSFSESGAGYGSGKTPITEMHNEAWLDEQLKKFKAEHLVATAVIRVTSGGQHSVWLDEPSDVDLANNVRFVQSGQKAEVAKSAIFSGIGQPSLKARVIAGLSGPGTGHASSDLTAGGDGSMFRTVGWDSGGIPFGNCGGTGQVAARMIAHPRVLRRADCRIHKGDFGYHHKDQTGAGESAFNHVTDSVMQYGGYNETLHEGGIGAEDFAGCWVNTDDVKQEMLAEAAKRNVTHINTIPVEKFFFTSSETQSAIHKACEGLKPGVLP